MKVRCINCKVVEDISGEDLTLLAHMITRYNQKPKTSDYTAILSIIKGECKDGKRHTYVFDESFYSDIEDIRNKHEEFEKMTNICNENISRIEGDINRHMSEIKDLEAKARELELDIEKLQGEKDSNVGEIKNLDVSLSDIISRLENLTGIKDTKIWF